MKLKICGLIALLCAGCVTTRSQLKQEEEKKEIQSTIQETRATSEVRFQDIESQFRNLNGRIEVVEHHLHELRQDRAKQEKDRKLDQELLDNKFKLIQEALLKIEGELQKMSGEIVALKYKKKKESESVKNDVGNYTQAEQDFAKKRWKEAIVGYQKYRDLNPKGRRYDDSTYKIGVCFQELGLKSEAKVFYQEVIEKFPTSRLAQKAQYRLKNLK